MEDTERRRRVVIEGVKPEVDCGRFAIKRTVGETVEVEADVFADGHDAVSCVLLYKREGAAQWSETPMKPLVNDRWRGSFVVEELGRYLYTIEGWVDRFATWRRDMVKRVAAQQDVTVDLLTGAKLAAEAAARAAGPDAAQLLAWAKELEGPASMEARQELALRDELAAAAMRYPDRTLATRYGKELPVTVDRVKARFSSWYELFPRSASPEPGRHGTLKDVEARLDYIASMGFDVLYLAPIHPIGRTFRKGKNNSVEAQPDDVGSPWAIGSEEGGHKAIHPQLGTFEDFESLRARAQENGLEIAMDIAYQCSPDHPYVKEHPEWFRQRPDGSIQYAENPPKKYQDIYPIDFESEDSRGLWEELKSIVEFWIDKGVRIFRVDNPHTKAFPFWEWMIGELKRRYPELIFLSEAFTRPKVMYRLAKLGFTQSYTYFTWRNTKHELTEYFTELTKSDVREYFRPNLWPNTPDILSEYLQFGGRPAFIARAVLAGTLGANWGIYGPSFELFDNRPARPGSEEYLDSEKYQIRYWTLDNPWTLRDIIARINAARRENPALQQDWELQFHPVDNDMIICYSKATRDRSNVVLVVVNLDTSHTQAGWVHLDLASLGLEGGQAFQAHDLLSDSRYLWSGSHNYVELNPGVLPAHLFRLRRRVRTEHDFDYFL